MLYKCRRCGFSSKYKSNYKVHLHRKFECKASLEDISIETLKQEFKQKFNKVTQNDPKLTPNDPKKYECEYCYKEYSKNCHLHRHQKTCKEKEKYDQQKEQEKINQKEILDYFSGQMTEIKEYWGKREESWNKEREELNNQIKLLLDRVNVNNIKNDNSGNNNKNYTINIGTQVLINSYGEENKDYISGDYLTGLLKGGMFAAIPKLVQHVHFNEDHPENHNLKITNSRGKYAKVYNAKDKDWKNKPKNDLIDELVDDSYNMLDNHHEDEGGEKLTDKQNGRVNHFVKKYDDKDPTVKKRLNVDTECLVLNESKKLNVSA